MEGAVAMFFRERGERTSSSASARTLPTLRSSAGHPVTFCSEQIHGDVFPHLCPHKRRQGGGGGGRGGGRESVSEDERQRERKREALDLGTLLRVRHHSCTRE